MKLKMIQKFKSTLYTVIISLILFGCRADNLESLEKTIYLNNNDASLPAYLRGNFASKKIIILLHGGPGGNGLEYSIGEYAKQLEESYGLVYLDQRGQGMAQGNYSGNDITIAKLAEDVFVLVKVLRATYGEDAKIILLGHSWGGMLGSYFMINPTYQIEVDAWIESNGAHDLPLLNKSAVSLFKSVANEQIAKNNSVEEWKSILEWANGINTNSISDEESGQINEKGFEVEGYLKKDKEINESIGGGALKSFLFGPTNLLTSFITGNKTNGFLNNEIEMTSLTAKLNLINKPVLFLYSKYDFVVPSELGSTAYENVSSSNKKLVIFEKSGHSPMDSEPAKFVSEVKGFIDSIK